MIIARISPPETVKITLAILLFLAVTMPSLALGQTIIAHRGASGDRPEHTLAAYELAIDQGAEYIEPDLVVTKDLVLIARHENELSITTDVASREEFEDRRRSKTIDGQLTTGWFAEEFTLAEIRTLRARERTPGMRPANARFDGLYQVATLAEIVNLVRAKNAGTGRQTGLLIELKQTHFLLQDAGIDVADLILKELDALGVRPDYPAYIQSFEVGILRRLDKRSDFRLAQIVGTGTGPVDEPAMRYAEMITPSGLAEISTYADALAADIRLVLASDGSSTGLVQRAEDVGLPVLAWTLRKENAYLPPQLRSEGGESAPGNMGGLFGLLSQAGVDGVITDDPGLALEARGAVP